MNKRCFLSFLFSLFFFPLFFSPLADLYREFALYILTIEWPGIFVGTSIEIRSVSSLCQSNEPKLTFIRDTTLHQFPNSKKRSNKNLVNGEERLP